MRVMDTVVVRAEAMGSTIGRPLDRDHLVEE
jgi:hypothetical protein